MTFHRDLTLDDVHTCSAREYADLTARDADTGFHVAGNVNKMVRVNSPLSFYVLASVDPAVWLELSNTTNDSFLEMLDTPSSYSGAAGQSVQVDAAEGALEFGQKLGVTDQPTFSDLTLSNCLTVLGEGIITSTLGVLDDLTVSGKIRTEASTVELNNIASPTDPSADGGGIILKGATDKTITWRDSSNAWTFNQDVVIAGSLTVQGLTTTVNSTVLTVQDKNIELAVVGTPTDITADGGGITLRGATDKTIQWLNATDAWTFNQDIDALGNIIKTTGVITGGTMIAVTQSFAGNLLLSGNTLSSTNANGDIILAPNGTGEVVVDNLASAAGGVFKFTDNAFRAGLDAAEYVEMGHGGSNGFINAVGDGGLDFRFGGTTKANFTTAGHLHLLTDVDQKHTLKIKTANNLNATGIAWENSGGNFSQTIFRSDVGSNRSDLVFAIGSDANIDLLTNSFKIHGLAASLGRLEVLSAFQISSGSPGVNKVLTSDANGVGTWQTPQPTAGGWTDDGGVVRLNDVADNVVIGAATGNGKLDVHGTPGTMVGGFASGQFQVTGVGTTEFSNSVVTGHSLFGGNTQLWYFGSASSSNDDVTLINRQNAKLFIATNNLNRITILADGKVGVNEGNPLEQLDVNGNVKCSQVIDKTIFAQLSSSVDQVPGDTNPTVITYNTQDAINGLTHSTTVNSGEITVDTAGIYFVSPQPQVGKDSGAAKTDFDMFLQVDRGGGFVDEANSNIKLTIKDSDITDVIVSNFHIELDVGDKIRMMQRVGSSTVGLGLKNTDAEVGPPTIPRTPAVIFTMKRVGGIPA